MGESTRVVSKIRKSNLKRERRELSPISFDVTVDRIEVARNFEEAPKDELDWDVYLHVFEDPDGDVMRPNYVVVGHLFRVCDSGVAQVRAAGIMRAYDELDQRLEPEYVHAQLIHGFVEPLYDACRRAAEIMAANMDLDLDLPKLSPSVEIELSLSESVEGDK